jgi:ferredoxin
MVGSVTTRTIEVLPGKCIGAGSCVEYADDYFDQRDDDATVFLLRAVVDDADDARVERAVNVCPVAALRIREATN